MPEQCMALVRENDRDRYLATLFAPNDKQQHLFALYAFNAEIARIPFLVNEPQMGEIRLQWWLDSLEAIDQGQAQVHPVAKALADTIQQFNLPQQPLKNLVQARRFDLYADQMPTRNDLEGYLGETQSGLIQLACMILDAPAASAVAQTAGYAGVAYGLARILNVQPSQSKLIPSDESRENLVGLVKKRLLEARLQPVPVSLLPAFLPVALTEAYLRSRGKKPFAFMLQWTMWRAARKEAF